MAVEIIPVTNRRLLRKFIHLPAEIHAGHKNWVPPIYLDEWQALSPRKNPAFSYCDTVMALAQKNGRVVGRVMGIINHRYNQTRDEKTARFSHLETWQDETTVGALLVYIESWARKKGMHKIIGPYGFSDQDPEGFLIEGFDQRATIATYYNFEWMPDLVAQNGYSKDIDYVTYKIDIQPEAPEMMKRLHERVQRRDSFELVEIPDKKTARRLAKPMFELMNECYQGSNIYGYTPMDQQEMNLLLKRYLPLIDKRFIKGLKKGNEYVGFIIGIPDMTIGIQESRGHLFPFGFMKIIKARNRARQLDMLLGGIKEECRGLGGDILLWMAMYRSARKAGMKVIDSHHQMEANAKMRAASEWAGGRLYKRHRVFQKRL